MIHRANETTWQFCIEKYFVNLVIAVVVLQFSLKVSIFVIAFFLYQLYLVFELQHILYYLLTLQPSIGNILTILLIRQHLFQLFGRIKQPQLLVQDLFVVLGIHLTLNSDQLGQGPLHVIGVNENLGEQWVPLALREVRVDVRDVFETGLKVQVVVLQRGADAPLVLGLLGLGEWAALVDFQFVERDVEG